MSIEEIKTNFDNKGNYIDINTKYRLLCKIIVITKNKMTRVFYKKIIKN